MRWHAYLQGEQFDMDELAERFPSGSDPFVAQDDQGFYVSSTALDTHTAPAEAFKQVETLMTMVNALARAANSSYVDVQASGRLLDTDSGNNHTFASIREGPEIRARADAAQGLSNDQPAQPQPREPLYVRLALSKPVVAEALQLMGTGDLDWPRLYKIYEVIRDDVGGESGLQGWATRNEISAFTGSANRPDVSGDDARHARASGPPPRRAISHSQGREFVAKLLHNWMDAQI